MTASRVSAGVPTGGQFAPPPHTESDIALHCARPVPAGLAELAERGYCTDEWSRWQQGGCYTYAHALVQLNPQLRLGALGRDEESAGSHLFAHDDTHAYDSAGRHDLPYHGVNGSLRHAELDVGPDWYDYPDEEDLPAAIDHARRNGILTGRFASLTGRSGAGMACRRVRAGRCHAVGQSAIHPQTGRSMGRPLLAHRGP